MVHCSGITSDLVGRKAEHESTRKKMNNWKVDNNGQPFASRWEAQLWEDTHPGEHLQMVHLHLALGTGIHSTMMKSDDIREGG